MFPQENEMSKDNKLRVLSLGPLPPPLGGTTVLYAQLVRELSAYPEVKVTAVNNFTDGWRFVPITKLLIQILLALPKADVVSLHAMDRTAFFQGLILWILCKIFRKPWILRLFGGSCDKAYLSVPRQIQWLMRNTVLAADLHLFETKYLVQFFSRITENTVAWYPNSRPLVPLKDVMQTTQERASAKRFVFMGHVRETKGIREIITAGEQLDSEIAVDIYGPFHGDMTEREFAGLKIVRYCGVLKPQDVIPTLQTYDVLLLPSYWEGYAGVVLEAYSAGIPVIATRCGGTPEIVDETSGILIEPKDSDQLLAAMKKLIVDERLYQSFRRGVAEKRAFFASERWTDEFVKFCNSVLRR